MDKRQFLEAVTEQIRFEKAREMNWEIILKIKKKHLCLKESVRRKAIKKQSKTWETLSRSAFL